MNGEPIISWQVFGIITTAILVLAAFLWKALFNGSSSNKKFYSADEVRWREHILTKMSHVETMQENQDKHIAQLSNKIDKLFKALSQRGGGEHSSANS